MIIRLEVLTSGLDLAIKAGNLFGYQTALLASDGSLHRHYIDRYPKLKEVSINAFNIEKLKNG